MITLKLLDANNSFDKAANLFRNSPYVDANFEWSQVYPYNPSLGASGPCSRWEGLSALMNLQAVLTVLVTSRVSHVRVVAREMPD